MYDLITDRFPSAAALAKGALVCCADVAELKHAGLGTHDLHVELVIDEVEDEDGVYIDAAFVVKIRERPFQKEVGEWYLVGRTDQGFSLMHVPFGREELLRWISDLEDALLDDALDAAEAEESDD